MKSVCVYCSSSSAIAPEYLRAAEDLGERIGRGGHSLVYGGTNVGLMGALALAVRRAGGRVTGVVPAIFRDKGIAWLEADELIVTADLRERKAAMEGRADAFIALPGGFGTLEEIAEVLVLKQLRQHNKPIVFLNTLGFYDPLIVFFEQLYRERFSKEEYRKFYFLAPDAAAAIHHIESYSPPPAPEKWFRPGPEEK